MITQPSASWRNGNAQAPGIRQGPLSWLLDAVRRFYNLDRKNPRAGLSLKNTHTGAGLARHSWPPGLSERLPPAVESITRFCLHTGCLSKLVPLGALPRELLKLPFGSDHCASVASSKTSCDPAKHTSLLCVVAFPSRLECCAMSHSPRVQLTPQDTRKKPKPNPQLALHASGEIQCLTGSHQTPSSKRKLPFSPAKGPFFFFPSTYGLQFFRS